MTRQEIEDRRNVLFSLVKDREAKLKEHDYASAKLADGRATKEEYAEVIEAKTRWSKEINDAEAEIERLEAELAELPEDVPMIREDEV